MKKRFTLTELLVVIAVIAILASLLLPVLARAKYMAKLVACMNTQRQIAAGCVLYASDHNGKWPNRPANSSAGWGRSSALVYSRSGMGPYDDRQLLNRLWDVDVLQCPLVPRAPLMDSQVQSAQGTYAVFAGWRLASGEERLSSPEKQMSFGGKEFDILVTDRERVRADVPQVRGIHPDRAPSLMSLDIRVTSTKAVIDYVVRTPFRGPIDRNFTRTDGSSFRINRVTTGDSRLIRIPYKWKGFSSSKYSQLPEEGVDE